VPPETKRLAPADYSYGSTAAIVTSMALVVGFEAADIKKATIVSGLFVIALADNLSDSLSIHVYQEAERIERRRAFASTVRNFLVRVFVTLSFIAIIAMVPTELVATSVVGWGTVLLVVFTVTLARERGVSPLGEVWKHLVSVAVVLGISRFVGVAVPRLFH